MAKNSRDDILRKWEQLLKGARENGPELAGVTELRKALEEAQAKVLFITSLRATLRASSWDATEQLRLALAAGRDAAFCLRSFVKSRYGPRSEKLREFGLSPSHRRRSSGGKAGGEGLTN